MRVAVTGAGGLLGQAVMSRLSAANLQPVAISSSLPPRKDDSVRRWSAEFTWERTSDLLHGIDTLIHAAAHIPGNQRNPDEAKTCFEVNALGTLSLLRACEAAGVKRFVFVSGANILKPRRRSVHENDTIGCEYAPYYLGSKALAEIYIRSYQVATMHSLIVRPSTIYGPGMKGGVLQLFADRLQAGQPILLKDGGRYQSDYVWRDDVASFLVETVLDKRTGVVNIGSGEAKSLIEVARTMCEILGLDPQLIQIEPASTRHGATGFSAVGIEKAQRWYGYHPIPLTLGLRQWLRPEG